jgi:hypothetical protein
MRFGVTDQVVDRFDRQRWIDDQDERNADHKRDRREILPRIIGKLFVKRWTDRQRAAPCKHKRIAVGRGFGAIGGADRRAGAGPVLDHDRLAKEIADARSSRHVVSIAPAGGHGAIKVMRRDG